jgi:hypothetical protein
MQLEEQFITGEHRLIYSILEKIMLIHTNIGLEVTSYTT